MGPGKITKYEINLDLIKLIQFCSEIYDLWRYPPPMGWCMSGWVGGQVNGWDHVKLLKIK